MFAYALNDPDIRRIANEIAAEAEKAEGGRPFVVEKIRQLAMKINSAAAELRNLGQTEAIPDFDISGIGRHMAIETPVGVMRVPLATMEELNLKKREGDALLADLEERRARSRAERDRTHEAALSPAEREAILLARIERLEARAAAPPVPSTSSSINSARRDIPQMLIPGIHRRAGPGVRLIGQTAAGPSAPAMLPAQGDRRALPDAFR
jgi:hypothetical protein